METTMNNSAAKGLRGWWTSPSRSGLRLIISPLEYRRVRTGGRMRLVSAIVLTGLGVVTLLRGGDDRKTYGWAIWFLGGAAANAAFGSWELRIARETDQYSGGGVRCGFGFPASPNR
jgi:hypothetical protein